MPANTDNSPLSIQPNFLSSVSAWRWWAWLHRHVPWRQETICLFGKNHPEPRLSYWYGPPYTYSGLPRAARACPLPIQVLIERVVGCTGYSFNSVLLTLYRDGRDHVGWHADNEAVLGRDAALAVVSLGAARRFDIRHNAKTRPSWQHLLTHGSLILMPSGFQNRYKHRIAKSKRIGSPRISMSFRAVPSV